MNDEYMNEQINQIIRVGTCTGGFMKRLDIH